MGSSMSRDEVLALPATIDVPTACRALGLGRTLGYELARRGEFPCPVLRVGRRYLVPTAGVHALLGLGPAARPHGSAAADSGVEPTQGA